MGKITKVLSQSFEEYYESIHKKVESEHTIQARIMGLAIPFFALKAVTHELAGSAVRLPFAILQTALVTPLFFIPSNTIVFKFLGEVFLSCPSLLDCIKKVCSAVRYLLLGVTTPVLIVIFPSKMPPKLSFSYFSTSKATTNHPSRLSKKGFQGIIGMDKFKTELRSIIRPMTNKTEAKKYGLAPSSGLLMSGAPGNGKSLIAEKFAEQLGIELKKKVNVTKLDMSKIASPYIHETSKKIAEMMDKASQEALLNRSVGVIIIDEIDTIIKGGNSKSGGGGFEIAANEERGEFLKALESAASKGLFIIATTNYPEKLDPAIVRAGRFDHKIEISNPDKESCELLIKGFLEKRPQADNIDYGSLANSMEAAGLSVADIKAVIEASARTAFDRHSEQADKTTLVPIDDAILTECLQKHIDIVSALKQKKAAADSSPLESTLKQLFSKTTASA